MDPEEAEATNGPPHAAIRPGSPAVVIADAQERAALVHRYATRVTVVLMLVCPALFLAGMWGSGIQPEQLFAMPEHYKPASDICIREGWQRIAGKDDLVRVCSEWLDTTDPSGETHRLEERMQIIEAVDGRLYFDHGSRADWHLAAFLAFVASILAFGWFVRRYLVARYRRHLDDLAAEQSFASHLSS